MMYIEKYYVDLCLNVKPLEESAALLLTLIDDKSKYHFLKAFLELCYLKVLDWYEQE